MRHEFIYNGMNSADYGLHTSGEDTWTRPSPDVTRIQVPGRNGDLIQLGNRFENVDITYHCGIVRNLRTNFDAFAARLFTDPGYHRLEDSYHPEHFRMAVFESALEPDVHERAVSGEVDIKFNCKPQMYLKTGELEQVVANGGFIYNPSAYTSLPLVCFAPADSSGAGFVTIGAVTISFSNVGTSAAGDTVFDCERQDIYALDTSANRNGFYTLDNGVFFELKPGRNRVSFSGLAGGVRITPRWWTV